MSVIIRLQNLPWSANSLDIRHYFRGLSIPEGGVHIVGGEMGDAFIAFSTDEDARQAMMMTGGKIKEVQISLMLSSRNEMQKVIEAARQASMTNSLAQLLGTQNVPPIQIGQQQTQGTGLSLQLQQQHLITKDRRESRDDKKDSSDMSTSSYDTIRRDKKEKSRSRSRDRMRKDRRERDRDRDRRKRSRSRSRSRERRRRRSHSRSRGRDARDRDRKDGRDDMKKDKAAVSGNNNIQDASSIPNMDILSPNQWRLGNPAPGSQNPPALNSLNNMDLLRNFTGAKSLLQGNSLGAGHGHGPVPLMSNDIGHGDRFQNVPGNEELGYGSRGRGGDFPNTNPGRRDNREVFNRDGNSRDGMGPDNPGRGGFRNFDDGNSPGFPGNFHYGDGNHLNNNFGNMGGYQQRNGNDGINPNRYNNFNSGDGYLLGNANNREQRGLLDYPLSLPNEGFSSRNDRFDQTRDDRVDEFGRSIQLRNRKKTDDNFKDEEFGRNPPGAFSGFQSRFGSNPGSGPQPLLRGRDSWPPGRQGDPFSDRRGFRGGFDEGARGNYRNDFSHGRSDMRPRRDDFHIRDRSRFGDKRDEGKYERDSCVEIRGLAPSIAYGDVRRPFNSLKVIIKDIKFFDYTKTDKKCRLKFLNHENKKKALQNTKKIVIEGKQIQLLHINDSEFEECTDEGVRRTDARFSDDEDEMVSSSEVYLQVKDLISEHTESDVAKVLSPAPTDKIVLETTPDGKTKTALVKFTKAVDAKVALGTPCRKIGEHSVLLAPLTQRDFVQRVGRIGNGSLLDDGECETNKMEEDKSEMLVSEDEEKGEGGVKDCSTDCIVMKNLPFEASDRDICDFFSDIGLVPKRIHLMLDARGQPSGEAFCEFTETEQARTACSKNSVPMGKNNIVVQKVPRAEMNLALGVKSDGEGGVGSESRYASPEGVGRPQCVVAVENIPFRAGVFDIINFFGWSYKLTEEDIIRKYNERGQPTGDARVTFRTPEDAMKAIRFLNNRPLMGRPIRMKIL